MTNMTIMLNMTSSYDNKKGTQPKSCAVEIERSLYHLKLSQCIAEVAVVSGVCFQSFFA